MKKPFDPYNPPPIRFSMDDDPVGAIVLAIVLIIAVIAVFVTFVLQ